MLLPPLLCFDLCELSCIEVDSYLSILSVYDYMGIYTLVGQKATRPDDQDDQGRLVVLIVTSRLVDLWSAGQLEIFGFISGLPQLACD
jgi:hypothetical protein